MIGNENHNKMNLEMNVILAEVFAKLSRLRIVMNDEVCSIVVVRNSIKIATLPFEMFLLFIILKRTF